MKESFHIICGEKWCVGVRYIIPWCVVFVNVYFLHEFGSRADIQQDMVLLLAFKCEVVEYICSGKYLIVVVFSKVCFVILLFSSRYWRCCVLAISTVECDGKPSHTKGSITVGALQNTATQDMMLLQMLIFLLISIPQTT